MGLVDHIGFNLSPGLCARGGREFKLKRLAVASFAVVGGDHIGGQFSGSFFPRRNTTIQNANLENVMVGVALGGKWLVELSRCMYIHN